MEAVNYTSALLWYATWPLVIYISYQFIRINIEHLEENLEPKDIKSKADKHEI